MINDKPTCVCGGELQAYRTDLISIISCGDCPEFEIPFWDINDFEAKWLELGGKLEDIV